MSENFIFPIEQRGQILRLLNLFTNHPGEEIHWQPHEEDKTLAITVERVPSNVRPVRPGNPEDWREHSRGGWEEHRRFPMTAWSQEVSRLETRLGYIEWVEHKLADEENSGPGVWVRATFTIDDVNSLVGYHLPGNTWNGWETPAFEKDEFLRWAKLEMPDQRVEYVENMDAIYIEMLNSDPDHQWANSFNVMTEDGPKHLYSPDGWTWDLTDNPDAPCDYCGHTREAHIGGGDGRCGLCNCPKFMGISST